MFGNPMDNIVNCIRRTIFLIYIMEVAIDVSVDLFEYTDYNMASLRIKYSRLTHRTVTMLVHSNLIDYADS